MSVTLCTFVFYLALGVGVTSCYLDELAAPTDQFNATLANTKAWAAAGIVLKETNQESR